MTNVSYMLRNYLGTDHIRIINPTVISSAIVWASLAIISKVLGLYIYYAIENNIVTGPVKMDQIDT